MFFQCLVVIRKMQEPLSILNRVNKSDNMFCQNVTKRLVVFRTGGHFLRYIYNMNVFRRSYVMTSKATMENCQVFVSPNNTYLSYLV